MTHRFDLDPYNLEDSKLLHGFNDQNLRLLKQLFEVDFVIRNHELIVNTPDTQRAEQLKASILALIVYDTQIIPPRRSSQSHLIGR